MSAYNEGDLVEAVKGETVIRGRVELSPELGEPILVLPGVALSATVHLIRYGERGFTITVIEKAAPKLPTEPGAYHDKDGDLWILDRNGAWSDYSSGYRADYERPVPLGYAPLSKLEPVAFTAKEVLREVAKFAWADGFGPQLNDVAKQFGVTS